MAAPVKPNESECCGSGCKPCVFDVYEEHLKKWKSNQSTVQSRALSQIKYLPFVIVDVQIIGSLLILKFQAVSLLRDQNCIYIQNAQPEIDYQVLKEFLSIRSGEYLIMKGVHESSAISRSYTPILNQENFENGIFAIVVSLQPRGKMSEFLAKLKVNDIVFWRGPYQEFTYQANSYRSVFLIGGGTGVVPLYNISKSIVEDDNDDTLVNVMASFKSVDCIILRDEFKKLRDFWNFKIVFYVSNRNGSGFKANFNETVLFSRISEAAIKEELKNHSKGEVFVVVCGPEGFNRFVKESLKNCGVDDGNIFIFWYIGVLFEILKIYKIRLLPSKFCVLSLQTQISTDYELPNLASLSSLD